MKKDTVIPENAWALKRSVQPYIGLPVILIILSPIFIWSGLKTGQWSFIGVVVIGALLFLSIIVRIGTRYRVWWTGNEIIRRTSDGFITTIKVEDISKVEKETSDLRTLFSLRRPSQRITVYGNANSAENRLDISLKHFTLKDIRKLLNELHNKRPDLLLPEV